MIFNLSGVVMKLKIYIFVIFKVESLKYGNLICQNENQIKVSIS